MTAAFIGGVGGTTKIKNNPRGYEQIIKIFFSGNVENGPRNRLLYFDDVRDSGGTLNFQNSMHMLHNLVILLPI